MPRISSGESSMEFPNSAYSISTRSSGPSLEAIFSERSILTSHMGWQKENGRVPGRRNSWFYLNSQCRTIHPTLSGTGRSIIQRSARFETWRKNLTHLASKENWALLCVTTQLSPFSNASTIIKGWIYLLPYFRLLPTQEWWYNLLRKANISREYLVFNGISSKSISEFGEFNSGQISVHLLNTCYIPGITLHTRNTRMNRWWALPAGSSQSYRECKLVYEWQHYVLSGAMEQHARVSFQGSVPLKFSFLFILHKLTFSFLHPCWDSLKSP